MLYFIVLRCILLFCKVSCRMYCIGLVWFGLVWFGLVWFGLVWSGLVWFGLVWFGLVWFGLVWFGLVWFGLVWFGLVDLFHVSCHRSGKKQIQNNMKQSHRLDRAINLPQKRRAFVLIKASCNHIFQFF